MSVKAELDRQIASIFYSGRLPARIDISTPMLQELASECGAWFDGISRQPSYRGIRLNIDPDPRSATICRVFPIDDWR